MKTATLMVFATGFTVARQIADLPGDDKWQDGSARISRTIIGGTFATAMLLGLDQIRPDIGSGLALVAFLTALLVHGVALAEILNNITK